MNNLVIPDYTAIVDASRPLVAGLASLVKKTAKADALSSRETIELLMSFCQDIPYGIPPNNYKNKVISGIFPPPLALNKTWGDCDTKAILFAATYLSLPGTSIALLESPGHVSIGVEGIPSPYDNAYMVVKDIEFDNDGNLWVANTYVTNKNLPVHVRNLNNEWRSYGSSETSVKMASHWRNV